jgi:ABC-type Mn2+/Zn2+ transport system ATPase subunit
MTKTLIQVRGADFGYGQKRILAGVDLAIENGEFLGILGPNGAGKTTLFRGLLGLIRPQAGVVERGRTRVGYVPQQEKLDAAWPLSVLEIIKMGIRHRITKADRREAHESLAKVGLEDRASATFANLSGGQRQRVLIARALMGSPEVLFLDEPTSGVDRPNQILIMDLLRELNESGEQPAILLVAHEVDLLGQVARGALWVDDGAVERVGDEEFKSSKNIEELFAARHGARA